MFIKFKKLLKSKIYIGYINKNIHCTNYKFIYKIINNKICIYDFTIISIYLYKLYLYIYNINFLNQKILFINNNKYNIIFINNFIIKICKLMNYFYILKWIPGLLTNWIIIKKKIIVYLWLNKILFNIYFTTILSKKCLIYLKNLYNKLFKYLDGIKYMINLPKYIFLMHFNNNIIINEIIKLKLILISFINISMDSNLINIKIIGNNFNYKSLCLIFKIIYTSMIYSKIKNM
uniref:Small subunit ribosomal protein 2 n=1 Tax=Leucocytozoon caulleryi TaxID=211597 RepID=U3TRV1_LEUCU|nr:small subunit ribosomal protein 2 [Leucocytozoon caulleryi]BAN94688.1 small subunit ribosomal protein 2 [Leucocytozoon caulleryi]